MVMINKNLNYNRGITITRSYNCEMFIVTSHYSQIRNTDYDKSQQRKYEISIINHKIRFTNHNHEYSKWIRLILSWWRVKQFDMYWHKLAMPRISGIILFTKIIGGWDYLNLLKYSLNPLIKFKFLNFTL